MDGPVIAMLGVIATVLIAALGAVAGASWRNGRQTEKTANLDTRVAAVEADVKIIYSMLAKGDARFSEVTTRLDNLTGTLDELKGELKEVLTDLRNIAQRTRPRSRGGDG